MVETRRGSSSSKRPLSSPSSSSLPTGKRSKAVETSSSTNENRPAAEKTLAPAKESGGESREEEKGVADRKQGGDAVRDESTDARLEGGSLIEDEKNKVNGSALNRGKKRQPKSNVGVAWGKLLSQCSQNPHVVMHHPVFTVGQGRQCDLSIGDPSISKTLCNLRRMESEEGSPSGTLLTVTGGKGIVKVNGKVCPKHTSLPLNGGDEVVFSPSGKHAYIFQQLSRDNLASDSLPPTVSILGEHSSPMNGLHFEASGDPSTVAGASVLASFSNLRNEFSLLPPPSCDDEDVQPELPTLPFDCEVSDNQTVDADMKDAAENDGTSASLNEKAVQSTNAGNENITFNSSGHEDALDAEIEKVPETTPELRPLLRMLSGSSAPEFDLSTSISKILDQQKDFKNGSKDLDGTVLMSKRRQSFKEGLQQRILRSENIEVSIESFPYYLRNEVQAKQTSVSDIQPRDTKLEARVAKFISLICNVSMMKQQMMEIGYNADKLPLGKLSRSTISEGYMVLKKIADVIGQSDRKALEQLSGEFYTVIPHDFGFKKMREFVIDTPQKLKRKLEMVEALGEIVVATKLLEDDMGMQEDPLYSSYQRLNCDLLPLEVDSKEFSMVSKYMKNTHAKTHSNYSVDIVQILQVSREGEAERFKKFSGTKNRMLLWHGSRLTNWTGILKQGLRIAPPEAPVTGYMFGKGVYFADMFSKSANYCCSTRTATSGVLLLCEVALGDMAELLDAKYDADKLPDGKLSTKGVGATAPDFSEAETLEDGVVVPLGKPKQRSDVKASLLYNEYIVYNPDQIRMQYVVHVNFNFKR